MRDRLESRLQPAKAGTPTRDAAFLERERHANVRAGDVGYPCRSIRTRDFLYIRNLRLDRWPAGDPQLHFSVGPYGDVDNSLTKQLLLANPEAAELREPFRLTFGKRPAEELYDLRQDPGEIKNVAGESKYAAIQQELRARLDAEKAGLLLRASLMRG